MIASQWLSVPCLLVAWGCSEAAGDGSSNAGGSGGDTDASVAGSNSGGSAGAGGAQAGATSDGGAAGTGMGGTAGSGALGGAGSGGQAQAGSGGQAQAGSGGQAQAGSGAGGGAGADGGGASGCDPVASRENRELVGRALDELFVNKDIGAIERYWADPYLQHNPIAMSGVATFRSLMSSFVTSPSFRYERLRTLAECDLAVVQGRYSGTGVIFDMFRVENGKIIEHWDSAANQASETEGSTELLDSQPTAQNRAHVLAFLDAVLVSGESGRAAEFLSPAHVEHHGNGGTGPEAFVDYVTEESIEYSTVHHVIADSNFVFTLSEGELAGVAYGFYDLFRLDGGSIVEHWDSRRSVPASTASGLPIF